MNVVLAKIIKLEFRVFSVNERSASGYWSGICSKKAMKNLVPNFFPVIRGVRLLVVSARCYTVHITYTYANDIDGT